MEVLTPVWEYIVMEPDALTGVELQAKLRELGEVGFEERMVLPRSLDRPARLLLRRQVGMRALAPRERAFAFYSDPKLLLWSPNGRRR